MSRKRKKPSGRKINPTLYVFCEGKTEESYINLLKTTYRIPSVIIHSKIKGTEIDNRFIKQYQEGRPEHPKDQTFLFYDLDVKDVLDKLVTISNCTLLLSNPSVELWFLLHYKNQTAATDSKYCCKELEKRNKSYKKGLIDNKLEDKLLTKRREATRKAKALNAPHNPSTTVYILIELLDDLKSGQ